MQISAAALAEHIETSDDVLQIIQARVKEHKTGYIGNYKQAWGDNNPLIEGMIKKSFADKPSTLLESIINSKKENAFASASLTCVDDMVMSNNGAYYNTARYCTTTHADQNYMRNILYPSLPGSLMAAVYNPIVEIGTFSPDYTFITFYDPSGYASEFLMIRNVTQ